MYRNNVVPVVMGAIRSDYEAVAPPHSFIHVEDFRSARDLAGYLLRLNASDNQYNEYMAWRHSADSDDNVAIDARNARRVHHRRISDPTGQRQPAAAGHGGTGTRSGGQFIDTKFWCRLCAMIHDDSGHVSLYEDIERWWHSPGACTADRWSKNNQQVMPSPSLTSFSQGELDKLSLKAQTDQ